MFQKKESELAVQLVNMCSPIHSAWLREPILPLLKCIPGTLVTGIPGRKDDTLRYPLLSKTVEPPTMDREVHGNLAEL